MSSSTARPSDSLVVIRIAGESGPCSAWDSRSTATSEGVGRLVGDDQDLGGPGEQVDAHLAVELPFGLGHVRVPRPGDQVDPVDRLGAQRHGRHRLHPAEQIDLVRAGQAHRRHRRGRDLAVDRRSAGHHPRHARHLRGHDRHVGGGGQRVPAAGDVGADRGHRDMPVAQDDSGPGLDLEVGHRVRAGACAKVRTCSWTNPMSSSTCAGSRGDQLVDLLGGEPERLGAPAVEPLGVRPHCGIAALPDVGDDAGDAVPHFVLCGVGERAARGGFQSSRHAILRDAP